MSLLSLTLLLATIQRTTIRLTEYGRIPLHQLREMAKSVWGEGDAIRKLQNHPALATHLVTLCTTNLITFDTHLQLDPTVSDWLTFPPAQQADHITRALTAADDWLATARALHTGLDGADHTQTMRQWTTRSKKPIQCAEWREQTDQIMLLLPNNPPPTSLFYVAQTAAHIAPTHLLLTPLSCQRATATLHPQTIYHHLGHLLGRSLSQAERLTLSDWFGRATAYRITAPYLLTTETADQMHEITKRWRLKAQIDQFITPRHALVNPDIIPPLHRALTTQQIHLSTPPPTQPCEGSKRSQGFETVSKSDLLTLTTALEIVTQLGKYVWTPDPTVTKLRDRLHTLLPPTDQTAATGRATQFVDDIERVIHGTDQLVWSDSETTTTRTEQWLPICQTAIENDETITIVYRAPDDTRSRPRTITPHHIEVDGDGGDGDLYKLHAYCHLRNDDRCFRLDRIEAVERDQ